MRRGPANRVSSKVTSTDLTPSGKPRRPLRLLHGIPDPERRGPTGLLLSAALHLGILILMILPPLIASELDLPLTQGGGGPGPAGGGGGGSGGTGGEVVTPERLQYMQVAPVAPAAPAPVIPPPKPEPEPVPEPVVPPPVAPTPEAPVAEAPAAAPAPSQVTGTGGGSGNDGSAGNGPGTGGGVGSGAGTGRGSGTGPGTGGGPGDIYPPQVTNLALLPIPVPNRVRPYRMVAWFDVDERGNAKLIAFNPSRDNGYNRKIREMLSEVRFRPAVRADGTPIRDTVSIVAEAPR